MSLKRKDYVFVSIQCCLFLAYTLEIEFFKLFTFQSIRVFGLAVFVIGILILLLALIKLNKNISPFPSPKQGAELIQNGLYKYVRHPIYTGILFIAFGYGFYINSIFKLVISALLYLLFYFKSKYEELKLLQFYEDYELYKDKTGRFLPILKIGNF